jgi:putative DNA primase/helicase
MENIKDSGGWYPSGGINKDRLKELAPEKWVEIVRNVIWNILNLESVDKWETKWIEIFKNIKEQNKCVSFPIPESDIDMMWITMSSEMRPEASKTVVEKEEEAIQKNFVTNKTSGTYDLAGYLTRKYDIITVGEKEREMYVYQNGIYFRSENEIIFPEIQRILGKYITGGAKTETFHKIADMTSKNRSIFTTADLKFIPLSNGVYNMETKKLLPQSPCYKFTYQFPVIYQSDADCPKTKAFLHQVLTDEQFLIIQEWLGYYFYRNYMFKKAVILVGEGDTGKTTLLETIANLLGRDNISSVSLHKMSSDKFAAAHLYNKHGNIVDELSARDISDTGNFKIATGGGSISGEYKYGNQFSFVNFSKFTFACNKVPDVEDFDDEAYFGRWMIMRFCKRLQVKIPNFIQNLTTESERSGLFNFAMEGLARLLNQQSFSYRLSPLEIKTEMMRSGSSIAMFCSEGIMEDNGNEITKEEMYEAYSQYCITNGLAQETIKMLGTKFLSYVKYATDGMITISTGKQSRGWRNVKIVKNDDSDKEFNELVELSNSISLN